MTTATETPTSGLATKSFESNTVRKIQKRLLPFLFICYMVANLDRINVGFASLTMNKALGISDPPTPPPRPMSVILVTN